MTTPSFTRRDFISQTSAAAAMALLLSSRSAKAAQTALPPWTIGCHGRAFRKWHLSLDGLLDAIHGAGYGSAEIIRFESESAGRPATPESVAAMVAALQKRGMRTNLDYLDVPKGASEAESVKVVRRHIDQAQALGQKYLICLGMEKASAWFSFCRVLADAAAYGQERGVGIVIKQHHGFNNTPIELLGWMKQVDHPNFGLFFDAGNLVYYTGRNPVEELDLIAPYVKGFIAKDCTGPQYQERRSGDPGFGSQAPNAHGDEVMIQFGAGVVDLAGIVKKLKAAGFKGPVMVEGLKVGTSVAESVANAKANREYLEKIIAS